MRKGGIGNGHRSLSEDCITMKKIFIRITSRLMWKAFVYFLQMFYCYLFFLIDAFCSGGSALGRPKEPTSHELWQAEPLAEILLWEGHNAKGNGRYRHVNASCGLIYMCKSPKQQIYWKYTLYFGEQAKCLALGAIRSHALVLFLSSAKITIISVCCSFDSHESDCFTIFIYCIDFCQPAGCWWAVRLQIRL